MSLTDLSILSALRTKMAWHQTRQNVLAENVANADTPGFRARDMERPDFSAMLGAGSAGSSSITRTNPKHLGGGGASLSSFNAEEITVNEVTPAGNAVNLESQMMKVAENQMDYQLVTTLYSRSLGMLRTAISRRG